jgi:hypothetical protein
MKTGDKLAYADVCERIRLAVASILDDAADAAKLHNLVAQGKIKLDESDPTRDTYFAARAMSRTIRHHHEMWRLAREFRSFACERAVVPVRSSRRARPWQRDRSADSRLLETTAA